MLFAIDDNNVKIKPSYSGQIANCPTCEAKVKAYCGSILTWHWKHISLPDCDSWHEESSWHRNWKARFLDSEQEVVIINNNEKHRADVCLDTKFGKLVFEFQSSSISPKEVKKRENFYEKMVWIVKANEIDLTLTKTKSNQKTPIGINAIRNGFRWRQPKKWVQITQCPVFLELHDGRLFLIQKITPPGGRCYGWGYTFKNWKDVVRCAFLTGFQTSNTTISLEKLHSYYFWQPFRGAISQLGLSGKTEDKKNFKHFCEWVIKKEIPNIKIIAKPDQEIFEEIFSDQDLLNNFYTAWQNLTLNKSDTTN